MMTITNVDVEITGKTPLLMHRFPLEPIQSLEKKPIAEQAEIAAYRIPDSNELYIPGINIQRALIDGAAFSKGKGRASMMKSVAACLMISPEYCGLGVSEYAIDTRPVVMPSTKGRVLRHRPRIDEWSTSFALEFDDVLISATVMRTIVDDTGQRVGLLDFRPATKGSFGRFMVTKWRC